MSDATHRKVLAKFFVGQRELLIKKEQLLVRELRSIQTEISSINETLKDLEEVVLVPDSDIEEPEYFHGTHPPFPSQPRSKPIQFRSHDDEDPNKVYAK